jgi:hypothetical protein
MFFALRLFFALFPFKIYLKEKRIHVIVYAFIYNSKRNLALNVVIFAVYL